MMALVVRASEFEPSVGVVSFDVCVDLLVRPSICCACLTSATIAALSSSSGFLSLSKSSSRRSFEGFSLYRLNLRFHSRVFASYLTSLESRPELRMTNSTIAARFSYPSTLVLMA